MARTTIVVPCYNEALRLDVERISQFAEEADDVQLLFVNDGSRDLTLEILYGLERQSPSSVRILNLERNCGKAEAVRRGVLAAFEQAPEFVGYWDADLATPLEAIGQFQAVFERIPELELVMGSRVRLLGRAIERRWQRHLVGRCFATSASVVLGLSVYDTQCGAKLFRASWLTRSIFSQPFRSRWIFDVEVLARMSRLREHLELPPTADVVYELPLDTWNEVGGSKLRTLDFLKASHELWRIWRDYGQRSGAVWAAAATAATAAIGTPLRVKPTTHSEDPVRTARAA